MCYGYVPLFACLFSVKLSNKEGHERSIDVPVFFLFRILLKYIMVHPPSLTELNSKLA